MSRGLAAVLLAAVLIGAPSVPAGAMTGSAEVGGLRVELTSAPERPMAGQKTLYTARIVGADGTPVAGARVMLVARMPDGMNVTVPLPPGPEPGIYRGAMLFIMDGEWGLTVRISRDARQIAVPFREQVGR